MREATIGLAVQMLKADEGCELEAYPDPESQLGKACAAARLPMRAYRHISGWQSMSAAPWTYAYGQTGAGVIQGSSCTQEQADSMLIDDATTLDGKLSAAIADYDDLNPVRQAVLIDVAYNIGLHGLLAFHHILSYLAQGNMSGAASELLDSDAARELPARYQRLADRMRSGAMAT